MVDGTALVVSRMELSASGAMTAALRLRLLSVHDAFVGEHLAAGRAWSIAEGEQLDVGPMTRAAIRVPLVPRVQLGGRRSYAIRNVGGGRLELLHTGHIGTASVAGTAFSASVGRMLVAVGDVIVLLTTAAEPGLVLRVEATSDDGRA